ncbi:MAG: OmpH family outer membrane protein [Deltaproteobacteria bacterium]|uniref:OmpH family outer membrane protein n=1 Tax=Candidatus Zymogenus saltonus TaxID=2844893 RepID=A0A9D8PML8_9DELT|nr:OmpH family outer membrane protein [Candidatus Zymogenus saltonus]
MKRVSIIVTALVLSSFAVSAVAADVKIGVVNFELVMQGYKEGQRVTKELDARLEKAITEVKKKKEQLKSMKESLERDAGKLSLAELKERQRKLDDMNLEYTRMAQDHLRELQEKETELNRKITIDIARMVSVVAKEEGYTVILVNPTSGILYAPNTIDLTDKVIKKLNSQ